MLYDVCTHAEVVDRYFYIGAGRFGGASNRWKIDSSDNWITWISLDEDEKLSIELTYFANDSYSQ